MLIKRIIKLLPREFYRKGGWIVATVPVRAVLNLVGVAALLPVLQLVLDDNPTRFSPVAICLGVLAVIVLKNIEHHTCHLAEQISFGDIQILFHCTFLKPLQKGASLYQGEELIRDITRDQWGVLLLLSGCIVTYPEYGG